MSRRATAAERRKYAGKGLPVEKMRIFCAPSFYERIWREQGTKGVTIHYRYRHKGRECVLREITSTREGDARSVGLFEFEDGSMIWLRPEEIHTGQYGGEWDGKVIGGYTIERNGRTWL